MPAAEILSLDQIETPASGLVHKSSVVRSPSALFVCGVVYVLSIFMPGVYPTD